VSEVIRTVESEVRLGLKPHSATVRTMRQAARTKGAAKTPLLKKAPTRRPEPAPAVLAGGGRGRRR